jgi:hypothetical protein
MVLRDRHDERELPPKVLLSDGGEERASAATSGGEVRVADLLAFAADELAERKRNKGKGVSGMKKGRRVDETSRRGKRGEADSHPEAGTAASTSGRSRRVGSRWPSRRGDVLAGRATRYSSAG